MVGALGFGGLLLLFAARAESACPPGGVGEQVRAADEAIAALDPEALAAAVAALQLGLGCAAPPVTPVEAAAVHRVVGIHLFVTEDLVAAAAAFEAARWLDPNAPLGHDIGGPLQAAWDRAAVRSAPTLRPLREPASGERVVDGAPAAAAPAHLPFVLQVRVDDLVAQGWWVGPGAPLPEYPGKSMPMERKRGLVAGAVTSFGLAGVALAGAGALRVKHNHPETSWEDAQALVLPNRVVGGLGVGLAVAGVGLGGAALVQGRF